MQSEAGETNNFERGGGPSRRANFGATQGATTDSFNSSLHIGNYPTLELQRGKRTTLIKFETGVNATVPASYWAASLSSFGQTARIAQEQSMPKQGIERITVIIPGTRVDPSFSDVVTQLTNGFFSGRLLQALRLLKFSRPCPGALEWSQEPISSRLFSFEIWTKPNRPLLTSAVAKSILREQMLANPCDRKCRYEKEEAVYSNIDASGGEVLG